MKSIPEILAEELGQKLEYVQNVVNLMDEGNTIPFIARYRKEMHGAMDDTDAAESGDPPDLPAQSSGAPGRGKKVHRKSGQADAGAVRRHRQRRHHGGGGRPVPPLQAETPHPRLHRPGKRACASGRGHFRSGRTRPRRCWPTGYIDPEKGVNSVEEALQGANDIIAEDLSDDADIRKSLRELVMRRGMLTCTAAEDAEADGVYKLYYDFSQPISRVLDHQILAMNRGEKEGVLKPNVVLAGSEGAALVCRAALKPTVQVSAFVRAAAEDAYERLIFPSIAAGGAQRPVRPGVRRALSTILP